MSGKFSNFVEAYDEWDIEGLYADIKLAQGGYKFTPRKQQILRGLLCGYTRGEIAKKIYNKPTADCISQDCTEIYARIKNTIGYEDEINAGNIVRLLTGITAH
jgi:hypothetical protein